MEVEEEDALKMEVRVATGSPRSTSDDSRTTLQAMFDRGGGGRERERECVCVGTGIRIGGSLRMYSYSVLSHTGDPLILTLHEHTLCLTDCLQ